MVWFFLGWPLLMIVATLLGWLGGAINGVAALIIVALCVISLCDRIQIIHLRQNWRTFIGH